MIYGVKILDKFGIGMIINVDLQDWETETIDVNMGEISNDEDLGLNLAGGRDDPVLPGDSPVYIASITKGSLVDGKLKVSMISSQPLLADAIASRFTEVIFYSYDSDLCFLQGE